MANHQFAEKLIFDVCDDVLRSYLPAWKMPGENGEPSKTPFVMGETMAGMWKGTLMNDGVILPVQLSVKSSDEITLSIGTHPPEKVSDLQSEGPALLGLAPGMVDSPEALRIGANAVRLKLLPDGNKLIGRFTAQSGPINEPLATLPFVVSLEKS